MLTLSLYTHLFSSQPPTKPSVAITSAKLAGSYILWRLSYWMAKLYGDLTLETILHHPEQLAKSDAKLYVSAIIAAMATPGIASYFLGKSALEPYKKDFLLSIKNRFNFSYPFFSPTSRSK